MAYEEHIDEGGFEDEGRDLGPIDEGERQAIRQDLIDVKTLKVVLGSKRIRGVVVWCPDCEDDHYLGWDLLVGNLEQILSSGRTPVHEPAFEPDPDEYVSWDYARGFLDGYDTQPGERASGDSCAWCGEKLPDGGYRWSYCPTCGRDLAPVNLLFQLKQRGWSSQQIAELMEQSGFDPPVFGPGDSMPKAEEQ